MVMKNLFTGQPWRNRHETDIENRLIDMERGEERVRCMKRVTRKLTLSKVTQSCPAVCNPMDCSLSGSSIHGIFQERCVK